MTNMATKTAAKLKVLLGASFSYCLAEGKLSTTPPFDCVEPYPPPNQARQLCQYEVLTQSLALTKNAG